ncbi:prolipoprotein diacylglyceryl transferase [Modestobacter sp. DSM 44400]|uniref:prolipoprotein diacylglyceryl transferase n=1 Tax=Modestobacter sp. DSM 44400 TaxID=1550230 RepID=UPI0020C83413|nr:prolipoprotein diacylglyceryl transferase family protein [Modestobacter sp. DSM 44400]
MTYWFDAAPAGDPYPISVQLTGRRLGDSGIPTGDTFQVLRTLPHVLPGSGRVALSTTVHDIPSGEWQVTAEPVTSARPDAAGTSGRPIGLAKARTTGSTIFLPVARIRAPGARLGAWPSLVASGAVVALTLQFLLATNRHLPAGRLLGISLVACLLGLAGAKTYYLLTHRQQKTSALRAGMSVQGFILAAVTTLVLGSWWAGIPLGPMLDATAPGLLFGLMIGRLGCFFGGCCTGRPTASRWGLWSSDRAVGVRRIPVQLMESTLAGLVAAGTLTAVLLIRPATGGLLFIAGLAAYISGRQLLFPLRGIPRKTSWGRQATLVLATLVLLATVAWLLASAR